MASLSLKNVCKVYPNGFEAFKDFSLEVEDQEFIFFRQIDEATCLYLLFHTFISDHNLE